LSGSVVYNQETGKNDTLSGFKTTKNTIEFVNSNSDVPDSTYIAKKDLPAVDADQLFNLPQAKFIGTFFGNYYAVSKSMGKRSKCKSKSYLNQL
jgi:peptidyl-prolyl cis-trans isomerase D